MKRVSLILIFLLTLSVCVWAQPGLKDTSDVVEGVIVVKKQIKNQSGGSGGTDTLPGFKPHHPPVQASPIKPYVKVEYSLFLSDVKEVPIIREVNGQEFRDKVPVFDSAVYRQLDVERVYPQKSTSLARYFSENISYNYKASDSLRSDTMIIGVWITPTGKIRWAEADTALAKQMPKELCNDLERAANGLREWGWGKGGGFNTQRRFLRPSQFRSESYYCELYVIVSGRPQTVEQKTTKVRFAPFDIPLNSPPADPEHKSSVEKNRKGK